MQPASGVFVFTVVAIVVVTGPSRTARAETFDPHGDPQTGVLRVVTDPPSRGQCEQCHPTHGDPWTGTPFFSLLFTENTNKLAYWAQGAASCHGPRPDNYPLQEVDRIPDTEPDAGYFEANSGGSRRVGVELRGRWPGEEVYSSGATTPAGRYVSPHAQDPDMPRRDANGEGQCLNCHDPHGTANRRDLLVATYAGIGGHASVGPPTEYQICFSCHGRSGPLGMDPENRFIEDDYDPALNGERAGHQIRKNAAVALSWPANVRAGDMLPCYDCHNPHGSRGNNGVEPNGFLISDQRPGWSGLTGTLDDPAQSRRFCLGCHIPADGVPGSQTVEGIVMNALSNLPAHDSGATQSCDDCHGRDYTSPTGNNVHNPSEGG